MDRRVIGGARTGEMASADLDVRRRTRALETGEIVEVRQEVTPGCGTSWVVGV
jgi:hypothetical protein